MTTRLALLAVAALLTVTCISAQKSTPTTPPPPPLCPSQPKVTCECNCNCNDDQDSDDDVANTGHWTPLGKISIGSVSLKTTGRQAFHLPVSVPVTAKEVLLFVDIQVANTRPDRSSHVKLYTTHNGVHYAKYISVHTYDQSAWSTNSDNIWLPLFTSRTIYVKSPNAHYNNRGPIYITIDIIGYR